MEKAKARQRYIYFRNRDFYGIFSKNSEGIVQGIELMYFNNLPKQYLDIPSAVISNASDEMF